MKHLEVEKFAQIMEQLDSHFKERTFLIAISGGVDSIALAHIANNLGLNFALAHVNYKLRDKSSDEDAEFCKSIADEYQVAMYLKEVDASLLKKNRESIQMLCRNIRYDFFKEIHSEFPYDYILTAHHADDDNETLFLNLMRGSGINGLSGIKKKNKNILRPLLAFSKKAILEYATKNHLQWREDESNSQSKYDRNFLRNQIIPQLIERNPDAKKNINQSISYLKQALDFVDEKIKEERQEIFQPYEKGYKLSIQALRNLSDFHLHHLFEDYGFGNPKELRKLIEAQTGSKLASNTHELLKDREAFYLLPLENKEQNDETFLISDIPFSTEHPIKLSLDISNSENPEADLVLDADKVAFPLQLRNRKTGDVFHPSGFLGSKKISKFFKDEKIPNFEKDKIWLLTDAKNRVLCVIPMRSDRRFEVNSSTQNYLNLYL